MARRPFRSGPIQLELFRRRPATPEWRQLPMDARQKMVPLFARLLRAHYLARRSRETGDE